jgi:multisubunit Na+/H+ antiporter MnhB subunit
MIAYRRRGPMMQLERKHEPLAPYPKFLRRLGRSILFGLCVVAVALLLGVLGYRWSGGLSWLDSLYNASMILGGMGPVDNRPVIPDAEKWFASAYALFAGVAFLVIVGVMFAPIFHRFLHHFHLAADEREKK